MLYQIGAQGVVFLGASIAPLDAVGLHDGRPSVHPIAEAAVVRKRLDGGHV
jgi:hypothetical protein